ncbi:hypothetical protein [Flavicella sp.]|uniref:MORN repeat-containing protein n=1 Tax=Flavicella sp. TaxID=2957742 RepID=UPI0026374B6F|nr:hypothetical protein [Flavicella sp.]MDG1803971.1 hypothetical protein [Flavicella sp.]
MKKRTLIIIIIATLINVVLFVFNGFGYSKKSELKFLALKSDADSLLIHKEYKNAITAYQKLHSKYPRKIDIVKTQSMIDELIQVNEIITNYQEKIDSYETLIVALQEESTLTQKEFNTLLKNYHTEKENHLNKRKLDSIFISMIESEIEDLTDSKNLSISRKEMLRLKTKEGLDIIYLGDVVNDAAHGQGVAIFAKKGFYEGEWKNNKRHGYGSYYWQNGDSYEGEYNDDNREGYGTYFFSSGDVYMGQWKNNLRNGSGKVTNKKNKIIYDGLWKDDKAISKK